MSWDDIGAALIAFDRRCFTEAVPSVITWPAEKITPAAVARAIDAFARAHDVAAVSIDGPHGWRDPAAGASRAGVGRACEYATRTPGKTGTRGIAYPSTFLRWTQFSIDVFANLLRRPDVALVNDCSGVVQPRRTGYWMIECFPTSTWRTSGLKELPGHRRAPRNVVEQFARRLVTVYALPSEAVTRDHDDLQAVVSTLPAAGLLGGPAIAYARGEPTRSIDGVRIEGFIWDAAPAGGTISAVTTPPTESTLLINERDAALESCIERGVDLFRKLVCLANAGEAVGISYKGFVEHVHGVPFAELRGRRWSRSGASEALRLADQITHAAGRQSVRRGGVVIMAGMDTFIWPKRPPHTRLRDTWKSDLPYSRDEWLAVFPDGTRRLVDFSVMWQCS